MNCEMMSHVSGTAPPFVRHIPRPVAGPRHIKGVKRVAHRFDPDNNSFDTCARALGPCCKKSRRSTLQRNSPVPAHPFGGLPLIPSQILTTSSAPSPASPASTSCETGATDDSEPSESCSKDLPNYSEGCATRSLKRRVGLQDDTHNHAVNSAKRPRTTAPPANIEEEVPVAHPTESLLVPPGLASLSEETLPTASQAFRKPAGWSILLHVEPLPFPQSLHASPSSLSKWQAPRTSPLGPQTSRYYRRSHVSMAPSVITHNFAKTCLIHNLYLDNVVRNPYEQSAQWCEDLHTMKLRTTLHPTYTCPHEFHPSDPEYDDEWSQETWSDEEWSDDEDKLATPAGRTSTSVRIIAPEEQPRPNSSPFPLVGWNEWQPPLIVPSQDLGIHPPLLFPCPTAEVGSKEARKQRDNKLTEHADVFMP